MRELTEETGLAAGWTDALLDTYKAFPAAHFPGRVLAALPEYARPRPGDPRSPRVLVRTDAAGATYGLAAACHEAGCGFSLGYTLDERA